MERAVRLAEECATAPAGPRALARTSASGQMAGANFSVGRRRRSMGRGPYALG